MTRRVVIALTLVASLALGLTADAGAGFRQLHPRAKLHAAKRRAATVAEPRIKGVTPMHLKVGQKLSINGTGFLPGHTTVYFLRSGGGVAITKADSATKTHVVVTVPNSVQSLLKTSGTKVLPTRFQLRILTKRYGPVAGTSLAPVISPAADGSGGGPKPACPKGGSADSDNDGLTDDTEKNVTRTNACLADTDGDGVPDGYEYQAALDMNNTTPFGVPDAALPYPGKKPWPNPLDGSDKEVDHDGDSLPMVIEYQMNVLAHGPKVGSLQYSDGKQRSQFVAAPTDPALAYMDIITYPPSMNAGVLSDDERDADGDGLTNYDELRGRMTDGWWASKYDGSSPGFPKESPYPTSYPGVDPLVADVDGDGVKDGADDQDHDGLSNAFEVSRPWDWSLTYVSRSHSGPAPANYVNATPPGPLPVGVGPNPWARVNPFNPCKPMWSKTCNLYHDFGFGAGEDWAGPDPANYGPPPAAPWLYDANDYPVPNGETFRYF
jgi:hypothetical protein